MSEPRRFSVDVDEAGLRLMVDALCFHREAGEAFLAADPATPFAGLIRGDCEAASALEALLVQCLKASGARPPGRQLSALRTAH